ATLAIIDEVEASGGGAAERLLMLFQLAFAADGRLERRLRAWAEDDEAAAAGLHRIDRGRADYGRRRFAARGLPHDQAGLRAELSYAALLGGFQLGRELESQGRERAARLYHALLTRP